MFVLKWSYHTYWDDEDSIGWKLYQIDENIERPLSRNDWLVYDINSGIEGCDTIWTRYVIAVHVSLLILMLNIKFTHMDPLVFVRWKVTTSCATTNHINLGAIWKWDGPHGAD